jgi:hypothetical protein
METMRLILIFLHTFLTIFAAINLHPHLSFVGNESNYEKKISKIVGYVSDLFRISLYHTACILAVWFSRRYGAGLVRASGILLIGELFQVITTVLQHALKPVYMGNGELAFIVIHNGMLVISLIMTFRLAEILSKHQNSLLQIELLAKTVNDLGMEENFNDLEIL